MTTITKTRTPYRRVPDGGARMAALSIYKPRSTYPSETDIEFAPLRPTYWNIPKKPSRSRAMGGGWVYVLFDAEGVCLYVGKTAAGVGDRLAHHADEARRGILGKALWVPGAHHVVVIPSGGPESLERRLTAEFSPAHIRVHRDLRRDPDNPATLTEVLDTLTEARGLPMRVDTAAPTWLNPAHGPGMTREERLARAAEIAEARIEHYRVWEAERDKRVLETLTVTHHPDGHITLSAAPIPADYTL